jgi:macrolide transport system ATP-binding/permease protein
VRFISQLRLFLRSLFHRRAVDRDLDDEIRFHFERQLEAGMAAGLPPEDALLAAQRSLAGIESRKEECRDARGLRGIDHLCQDVHFALRQLRKSPGFTFTAVLVLALGLCAALTIFSFVDAALIKPLPYANPSRLAYVTERIPTLPRTNLSYLDYLDWKRLNTSFRSLDVFNGEGFLLRTPSGTEPVDAAVVSDGFFRTLGVPPIVGRDFFTGEDLPGAPRTVLLSYAAWQKRFGGAADVAGRSVDLSGNPYTIIGVLPRDFEFAPLGSAEFWATVNSTGPCEKRRSCHNLFGVARLRDGATMAAALADTTAIAANLERQYPDSNRGQSAVVGPLSEFIVGDLRSILFVLLGGAALLLLIAAVNVASLLLVRAENRRRELAVRVALGASAGRLFSQFATEGLLLVGASTAIGLLGARWSAQLVLGLVPAGFLAHAPFLLDAGLNLRVLACAFALALLAAAMFSFTPAVHFSLTRTIESLAAGSRGSSGTAWRRLGSKLVVLEFATAMVLLAGAGLLGKSLYRLLHVSLGFDPSHLATLRLSAPDALYASHEKSLALERDVLARAASIPGVESAALASTLPVSFNGNTEWIRFVGRPYDGRHNEVNGRRVSSTYFSTIGARILRGRAFTDADDKSKPRVVIINQALAAKYFPGEDPIGKQIADHLLTPASIKEVVGVVDDIREGPLDADIWPAIYWPYKQDPDDDFAVIVRTAQDPASVLPALSAALRQLYPDAGVSGEIAYDKRIAQSSSAYLHRSAASLVGGFAALALLLGVVGLYGVIAYSVSQRTREIGVRIALGAQRANVYRLILSETARLVVAASALGMVGAVAMAWLVRGMLYAVRSWDLPTFAGVIALLALAAMFASFFPARRAASVSPAEALRSE